MVDEPPSGSAGNEPSIPSGGAGSEKTPTEQPANGSRARPLMQNVLRWLVPVFVVALGVFLVIIYVNDWNLFDGMWPVEVTDDAYVRGKVRPLSTKVAGVVINVPVTDFQHVKAGDLIAQLRNDDFQARVDEAQAATVETQNAINQVKREEETQDARIASAQAAASVGKTNIDVTSNDIKSAQAVIAASEAAIKQTRAELVEVEASIRADEANAERADLEKNRQHALYADRATTKRAVEQIDADASESTEAIARDRARKNAIQQALEARTAELHKANDQLANSIDGHRNANDQYAKLQADLSEQIRQKQVLIAREAVLDAELKRKTAAFKDAQVAMDYTYIRAPEDGTISERKVYPGQLVSAGTQAATLVAETPWVVASYREIQLSRVFVGNRAEVTVDGLPGRKFKGKVDSISPASEAQFALLPPDNSSGNFTKISQRIPVKITFFPNQPDLERMRPGMSVIAHVWTKARR
jgi:membrane fusion protein (multidrug efflux system)